MSAAAPTAQVAPGRPETLTKEEEAKLKEFWTVALKVFGVIGNPEQILVEEKVPAADQPAAAAATAAKDVVDKKFKKGKIGSLLQRGKKDQPASNTASSSASTAELSVNLDEKDDKYGHTKEFKAALAGQTPAELRAAFWEMVKCDNPDALLLRFLRARKWDVDKALIMLVATMHWRATEMKVWGVHAPTVIEIIGLIGARRCMRLLERENWERLQVPITTSWHNYVWGRAFCMASTRVGVRFAMYE